MKPNYLILFNTKNRGTIEAIGTIIDPILFDRTNGENWNQLIRKLAMIRRKSTPSISLSSSIRTWNVRRIQPNKLDEMNKKLIFDTFLRILTSPKCEKHIFWVLLTQQLMQSRRKSLNFVPECNYSLSRPVKVEKSEFLRILTSSICEIMHFQIFADSATYAKSKRII